MVEEEDRSRWYGIEVVAVEITSPLIWRILPKVLNTTLEVMILPPVEVMTSYLMIDLGLDG